MSRPTTSEQSAGLSTGESDSSMKGSKHGAASTSSRSGKGGDGAPSPDGGRSAVQPPPLTLTAPSPSKKKLFSIAPHKSKRRGGAKSEDDGASFLGQSISNSAPTVLIQTPPSPSSNPGDDPRPPPYGRSLRSTMSSRTLHESLHRGRHPNDKTRPRMPRSVSFANVKIREYERILGDNPSVTSGPPLGIGWRHSLEPIVATVDEYENGKGLPRSSSEYLVPRSVRESLIKEHAGVSRREMATVVRNINREKAQRRKTVVNLSMQKTEERVEGAKRKMKKILKPSSSYESLEAKLWDEAHAVAMEKAKRLEDSIRRGESVSMRNVYSVGTPCNNVLPSRSNSAWALGGNVEGVKRRISAGGNSEEEKREESADDATPATESAQHDTSLDSMAKQFTPKSTRGQLSSQPPAGGSDGPVQDPNPSETNVEGEMRHADANVAASEIESGDIGGTTSEDVAVSQTADGDVFSKRGETPATRGPLRTSANIVASESEGDDIFAKLVLDDASHDY